MSHLEREGPCAVHSLCTIHGHHCAAFTNILHISRKFLFCLRHCLSVCLFVCLPISYASSPWNKTWNNWKPPELSAPGAGFCNLGCPNWATVWIKKSWCTCVNSYANRNMIGDPVKNFPLINVLHIIQWMHYRKHHHRNDKINVYSDTFIHQDVPWIFCPKCACWPL